MIPQIIALVGPTASGKSALAIDLAQALNGEVISADSRQVYRGLSIGTGKITPEEMRGVPHHMLDVADASYVFTAHNFTQMAQPVLDDIIKRGKVAIICGGTGFYIDALLGRIILPDVPSNPAFRATLTGLSAEELFSQLAQRDPHRAASIDRHNPVRLERALEIVDSIGAVPTAESSLLPYTTSWIGIRPSLDVLRERIHARLHARMDLGMLEEALELHKIGLSFARMEALGLEYRDLARLMQGLVDKDTMLQELELAIFQYAKRQLTYWKRNREICWMKAPSVSEALDII